MKKRDAVKAIRQWNSALTPADRHHKYCLMSESDFVFYRGTNHLFWEDFANDKRLKRFGDRKTRTWLQGDMHAENMGVFENDRGEVVYGVNDFDDAVIADYQFDLWRMATSIALVARGNKLDESKEQKAVAAFAQTYLETMRGYAGNGKAQRTYFTSKNSCDILKEFLKETQRKETRKKMLQKWTESKGKKRFFQLTPGSEPPFRVTCKLAPISADEAVALENAIPDYGKSLGGNLEYCKDHFKVEDAARRLLAGTGSTGTPRYYVLIEGEKSRAHDDRILDVKLQGKPAAYCAFDKPDQAEFDHCFPDPGERHAAAYRALTTVRKKGGGRIYADSYLGTLPLFDGSFSVRERSPRKETFDTGELKKGADLVQMSRQWAQVLATVHARAHDNFKGKPRLHPLAGRIAKLTKGRKKEFTGLVAEVAKEYADQVESDWKAFKRKLGPGHCLTKKQKEKMCPKSKE